MGDTPHAGLPQAFFGAAEAPVVYVVCTQCAHACQW